MLILVNILLLLVGFIIGAEWEFHRQQWLKVQKGKQEATDDKKSD